MRIGIYNQWVATAGGGEKHSLAIAEHLSRSHSVQVVSHTPVDRDSVASRLGLDLSRTEFITVPRRNALALGPMTEKYDLFINASHLDFVPSLAPRSVMVVYFPAPADLSPLGRLRRRGGLLLKKWLLVPHFTEGAFGEEQVGGLRLRRTDQELVIELPSTRFGYTAGFDLASRDAAVHGAVIRLDGEPVAYIDFPEDEAFTRCSARVPGTAPGCPHRLTVEAKLDAETAAADSLYKMAVARLEIDHPAHRLYRLVFERWFKEWGLRIQGTLPETFLDSVDTYDAIWAISCFTARWIEKYWRRSADLLRPMVNVEDFHALPKRDQVLSVGRFFAGSHNKKHLVMIRAFKSMVDRGLEGWKLLLVGGTTPGAAHEAYLKRVREEARGYPIEIQNDVSFDQLRRVYGESSIYWHASGYGESERRNPARFEHFGITTVEAMASGCVPVVIGKGGQAEIVRHGVNGYLWQRTRELCDLTRRLIDDPAVRDQLATGAVEDSMQYGRRRYQQRLDELLCSLEAA